MRIVLATSNPHKVTEMRAAFGTAGFGGLELVGLGEVGVVGGEPEETGATLEANATIKAVQYARRTEMWCLADDSGLEIDALGGRPGVISSHYATDGRETGVGREERDAANTARVLREMEGVPEERRGARFVCVMVLAGADGTVAGTTRGGVRGRIGVRGEVPRGAGGFGYDPVFLVGPTFARSGAELSATEKNATSHRGVAARAMAELLREIR